jgi:putative Holliday junction resolvase
MSEHKTSVLVLGLPRDMNGSETDQSKYIRDFANRLTVKLNPNVIFQDESLTSVIAEQNLRLGKDFSEVMLRDGTLDSAAAALILSDYLEDNGGEK